MAIRTKLRDRKLPGYTRGEEIFNMVSHISGGGFAVLALVACLGVAIWQQNSWAIGSAIVYGITMIVLYTMSSVYHGLIPETPKKVFQVIDHCAIFFLIAGTYTPIAMVSLRPMHPNIAWGLFAFMWGVCFLGATLNAIDLRKFRIFSLICYIGLGWSMLVFTRQLLEAIPMSAFAFLLGGGVAYTIGSILYMLGKRRRYMHSIFHLFVVAGSVLHFVSIILCFIDA
ncbi:MAG: hemolysin III family protein [Oscillospiraceae bacterium]|nr:hemolysin III family protein [Oscillospiraceae bacterium]